MLRSVCPSVPIAKFISDGYDTNKKVKAESKKLVNDQMWALVGQNKDDVV